MKYTKSIKFDGRLFGQASDFSLAPFAMEEGKKYNNSSKRLGKEYYHFLHKENVIF